MSLFCPAEETQLHLLCRLLLLPLSLKIQYMLIHGAAKYTHFYFGLHLCLTIRDIVSNFNYKYKRRFH